MKPSIKHLIAILLCAIVSQGVYASASSDKKAAEKKEAKEKQSQDDDAQKQKHDDALKKKADENRAAREAEEAAKAAHEQKLAELEAANRAERLRQEAADAAAKKAHEEKLAAEAAANKAAREKAEKELALKNAAKSAEERHAITLKLAKEKAAQQALDRAAAQEAEWVAVNGPRPPRPVPPVVLTPEEQIAQVLAVQDALANMSPTDQQAFLSVLGLNGSGAIGAPGGPDLMDVTMDVLSILNTSFSDLSIITGTVESALPGQLGKLAQSNVFKSIMLNERLNKSMTIAGLAITGTQASLDYLTAIHYAYQMPPTLQNKWLAMQAAGKGDANVMAMELSLFPSNVGGGFALADLVLSATGHQTSGDVMAQAAAINRALHDPATSAIATGAIVAVAKDTFNQLQTFDQQKAAIDRALLNPATSVQTAKVIADTLLAMMTGK